MAETTSAPSLRELSEAATQGELNYPNWGTDFRAGTVLVGMTSPAFEGNGRANRAYICRLWNDHRANRLIDPTTLTEAIASARAEGVREGLERAAGMEGRFWLELREPRRVPERKGSWPRADIAKVLREFMAARPQAYITVVTMGPDGPHFDDGPETLQMADARSMSTGRQHIERVRAAHGSREDVATLTPGGRTDG